MTRVLNFPARCSVCKKPVDLKTCKTDSDGRAVHEHCHLVSLGFEQAKGKKPQGFVSDKQP